MSKFERSQIPLVKTEQIPSKGLSPKNIYMNEFIIRVSSIIFIGFWFVSWLIFKRNIKKEQQLLNVKRRTLAILKSRNINSNFYSERHGTKENPDLMWYIILINGRLYGTWSDEPFIYYFDSETKRWVLDEAIIH